MNRPRATARQLTLGQCAALQRVEPDKLYPFEWIEGHVRVNLFRLGCLTTERVDGLYFIRLTAFGATVRALTERYR